MATTMATNGEEKEMVQFLGPVQAPNTSGQGNLLGQSTGGPSGLID